MPVRPVNKSAFMVPLLILSLAVILFSCKDEDNELGLNIQPPGDKLNVVYSDTSTIIAYSQLVDSVRTDETSLSLLGSLLDPVFGKVTTGFYTQFKLSQTSFSFGENAVADSLILTLLYDGHYGDSTSELTLKVYEMAEKIDADSGYYSNQLIPVKETLLAQKTFVPNYTDSLIIMGDTLPPHLRINLGQFSTELIDKLLNAPADSMETIDSFLNYFYGLYVTVEPVNSQGQIIYFSLTSTLSRMILYYHDEEDDSLGFAYTIPSSAARFGHFDHDYSLASPEFKAQVIDKDTTLGREICYVQSLAGVKTFLRFPNIKNYYNNGKIAVNEARLFLNCSETDPDLDIAGTLILVGKTDTTGYVILDDQSEGADYWGGSYKENQNGYWFRITMTVQDLMQSEDPDPGLDLYMSGGAVNAERVLLTGTSPQLPALADERMKLVITYTKLN